MSVVEKVHQKSRTAWLRVVQKVVMFVRSWLWFLVVQPKKLKVMWQIISSQVPPSLDLGLQVRLPIGQRWAAESGQPIAFFQPQSKVIPRFAYMGWVCSTRITRTGECIEIISWGAFEQINEFGRDDMIAQRLAEALRISLRANT